MDGEAARVEHQFAPGEALHVQCDCAFQYARSNRTSNSSSKCGRESGPGETRVDIHLIHGKIVFPFLLISYDKVTANYTLMPTHVPKRVLAVVSDLFFSVKLSEAPSAAVSRWSS